jgi:hypothetical protein
MQGKSLEMEIYADWEEYYGGAYGGLSNVVLFMKYVEQARLNIKGMGLYTGYYYFKDHSNPITDASSYEYLKNKPLWEAWYSSASVVKIPVPWTSWLMWQYGTPAENWGQQSLEIDKNKFNGDRTTFDARYGTYTGCTGTSATDRYIGKIAEFQPNGSPLVALWLRSSPASSPTISNALVAYAHGTPITGDVIVPDQLGYETSPGKIRQWLKITSVNGLPNTGYMAYSYLDVKDTQSTSVFWKVRGDEELAEYSYKSRTASPSWIGVGAWTPSTFRFDKTAKQTGSDYRVNITPLDGAIRKLNDYITSKINYLYSPETGMFNGTGFPKQQYVVMSGNLLEQLAIEGNFLKFKTLKPSSDTTGMTAITHPQYCHTWDLVGWIKNLSTGKWETRHKPNTPQGVIKNFLVSIDGYGYISLERVKKI